MVLFFSMYSNVLKKMIGHCAGVLNQMPIVHCDPKTTGFVHGNLKLSVFLRLWWQHQKIHDCKIPTRRATFLEYMDF